MNDQAESPARMDGGCLVGCLAKDSMKIYYGFKLASGSSITHNKSNTD